MKNNLFLLLSLVLLYSACTPYKKILVFQPTSEQDTLSSVNDRGYQPVIQSNDILDLYVISTSPEASKYFNFSEMPGAASNSMMNGYLVDSKGEIQIPLVGNIKVAGLTSSVAKDTVALRLSKYLVNPSVKLYIRNFNVTVIGEVASPGIYTSPNERMTLTEALALAGDLTIYSVRNKVTVIRDSIGFKTYNEVDLTSRELFASKYYMLHPNDILYVQPSKKKRFQGENFYKVIPVVLSTVTFILSIVSVINK
jgi:polysaccharide biosynthesis/export protein